MKLVKSYPVTTGYLATCSVLTVILEITWHLV